MIWQLMKRDYAWQLTPWVVVLFAAFGHGDWMLMLFPTLVVTTWIFTQIFGPCTLYEAALPVKGRELWLSRVASRLALLWLPVLAAAALAVVLPGKNLPLLFEAAAIWTVVLLGLLGVLVRNSVAPLWMWLAGIVLLVHGVTLFPTLTIASGAHLPPAGIVFAVCGLASVAIFGWSWAAAPNAFQVAPSKPPNSAKRREGTPSRFKWSPVVKTIYSWNCVFALALLFVLALGQIGTGFTYVLMYFCFARGLGGWLCAVPFSQRWLFRMTIAPLAVAIVLGSAIRAFVPWTHPLTLRAAVVETSAELTMLYISAFLFELVEWRRLSKMRRWIRMAPAIAGAAIMPVMSFLIDPGFFDRAFIRLVQLLPVEWWLLGLAIIVPMALTYWIAERTYVELEFSTFFAKPRTGG